MAIMKGGQDSTCQHYNMTPTLMQVTQLAWFRSVNCISVIDSSRDCIAATMLPNITIRKASRSAAENPDAWIKRICFSTVDLPESPAPSIM